MRVAMVTNFPVDPKVVPGGVTAVAHYLTRGLAQISSLDLHVVCCQPDVDSAREESRDGATIHFLPNPDRLSLLTNHRAARGAIQKTMRYLQPDLVHAQGLGLSAQAALDSKLPFAVTVHGVIWRESTIRLPSWAKRTRGKIRARQAYSQILRTRNVFIISEYAAQALPEKGNYRKFLINNPVGEEIFALENHPRAPHVLVVGGMRERKDPLTAVKVMARVLEELPEATMSLLGPPSNTSLDTEVEAFLRERKIEDRVKILGLVPEETLWNEYRRASLLLMTSLEETAPMAIGEGYAVGIPVVGTNAGGIPFMIREGETGHVHPIRDVEALASSVLELLTKSEVRDRFAKNARAVGQSEFSLEAISRKTFTAYGEILDS